MSVTEEASRVDSEANHARRVVEPLHPPLPDTIDPELSAPERARLANGPLALTRTTTQPGGLPATDAPDSLPRWFVWPRMRPASQGSANGIVALGGLWPLYWCISSLWSEFVGTWVLSWGLVLPLVGLLFIGDVILGLWGERLPLIGRSAVELRREGVRLRLFHGRRPRTVGKGFQLLGFIWPTRAKIAWSDLARVAVYSATYASYQSIPRRTMYWVKLWSGNGTGYVALITEIEAQAYELANLLVQHAGLSKWVALDGSRSSLLDHSLGPLDADTLIIWQADQRRIRNASTIDSVRADLWRAPHREFVVGLSLSRCTVIKLAVTATLLLTLLFSYDYLLSYLLWTPPGPITSDPAWIGDRHDAGNSNASNQTLIPPLHEVWHTKLPSDIAAISLGGGKLLAVSGSTANIYDAAGGSLLKHYNLRGVGDTHPPTADTISPDGNHLYFIVSSVPALYDNSVGSVTVTSLNALDLNTGNIAWQHPTDSNASFVQDAQHNLLIASSPITATISGTVQTDYVIEALNPQTGAQVWHSMDFGPFLPQKIVVGGDTVYAITGNANGVLVALDSSNGAIRWQKSATDQNNSANTLLADAGYVYAITDYGLNVYSKDGTEQRSVNLNNPSNTPATLVDGEVIASSFGELIGANSAGDHTFSEYPYSYDSGDITRMAASNGLLFLTTGGEGDLFGNQRLYAFDLQSGKQVWRSPTFNNDYTNGSMVIGNGMLYMIYGGEIHAFAGAR